MTFETIKPNIKLSNINQSRNANYLEASSIATATATVIPTMGLLPAPMRPIISVQSEFRVFLPYEPFKSKRQNTRLNLQRFPVLIVKSFSLNTSFSVLLTALYRVSMCSRIGCFESSQDVCK